MSAIWCGCGAAFATDEEYEDHFLAEHADHDHGDDCACEQHRRACQDWWDEHERELWSSTAAPATNACLDPREGR